LAVAIGFVRRLAKCSGLGRVVAPLIDDRSPSVSSVKGLASNGTCCTNDEQKDANLKEREDVVEPDAASSAECVDKTCKEADAKSDPTDLAVRKVTVSFRMSSLKDPQGAYDGIAGHVSNADEADAVEAANQ
jgi:hypothetical protein